MCLFGGGSYAATGGLHGVGASVVNALASRLDVEVDRDGKIYWMSFKRGVAGIFDGDGPNAPFEPKSGLRIIGKVSAKITGTRSADIIYFDRAAVSRHWLRASDDELFYRWFETCDYV